MTISNLTLQKEEKLIVGFIDLLGFESALNDDSFEKLFDLLKQLTGLKKNFCEKQIGITKEGNKQYSIEPSITAFSDSVVISYELGGVLPPVAIFTELSRNIAHIALIALSNGFLIRGAITQGADSNTKCNSLSLTYPVKNFKRRSKSQAFAWAII